MIKNKNNNTNSFLRVGIYLRLSDEDKVKKNNESESIKNQRHLLLEEIKKRENFILVDEYCDEDLSGAGTYRPEFERLINDCENKKLDVVLCKSQSRFSRDMEVIEKYIHNKFIEWNVRFISLSDNADTANVGNKKARQINGLMNEWYLEDVSSNIRSAFQSKMKQGEYISPFAAFGYKILKDDNNKLIIDEIAKEIVKKIFVLYLNGMGFMAIAKYLNDKNIPSPSLYKYQNGCKLNIVSNRKKEDIKWSRNTIKTILTNELYIGNLVQGKRTTISYKNHKIIKKKKEEWIRIEDTHEAIIDKESFKKVQNAIKERTKPLKLSGCAHIFSGKVFCLECGCYMRKKNSSKYQYLVCSNTCDGYNKCTNKKSIRYDQLEKIIKSSINNIVDKFYDENLLKKEYEIRNNDFSNILNILEERKKKIELKLCDNKKYLENLYKDKVLKVITVEQFKDLTSNYDNSNNEYKKQIILINNEINFYKKKAECKNNKFFSKINFINKVVIDEFIKKIYIGTLEKESNSRIIKISWNI